jgi:hypothetical protein
MNAMEELRKLLEKWEHGQWCATKVKSGCNCWKAELEALLPSVEAERERVRREGPLTPTGVELLERGVGMGLVWVWKNTVSLSEDDAEMLKQADPAQIVKDAEAKETHASNQ